MFFRNSTDNSFKTILLLAYVSIHPEKSYYLRKIKPQQELNEKKVFLGGSLSFSENEILDRIIYVMDTDCGTENCNINFSHLN